MTTTLSRPHVDTEMPDAAPKQAVVRRWHEQRRIGGLTAVALAIVAGVVLAWPAMAVAAVIGAGAAIDVA